MINMLMLCIKLYILIFKIIFILIGETIIHLKDGEV